MIDLATLFVRREIPLDRPEHRTTETSGCPDHFASRGEKGAEMLHLSNHHQLHLGLCYLLNVYYFLKPAIPQTVRFALRHSYALPLKWAFAGSWPIRPASCVVPRGWPGWPNGKSFAFVLTHDVEGNVGLARCRQLAELEMRLGFRSSFNFVPEGEYATPRTVRSFLEDRGFEVGVHDLRHDGKLYTSYKTFKDRARRINHYLKSWNAVGFRSGFMRHNLQWLQDLNIQYDASTFEHDPFEPQPDGMHTIFPFWVRRDDGSTYVELPYTLAQDSTLFLVLRETTNDVWKRKLDWIAAHGGMALVIVHPDYMAFDDPKGSSEYRAELYQNFLEYVRERYGDVAWFARPRDVADYVRQHHVAASPAMPEAASARRGEFERSA